MDYPVLVNYLARIHDIRYFMPPFAGTEAERKALAYYIVKGIQGKDVTVPAVQPTAAQSQGEELFTRHCSPCHPVSLVKARTASWDKQKIRWSLDNLNKIQSAMPDFQGTSAEKELLAKYLHALQGENARDAHDEGKEVFENNCAMCHSLREGANPVLPMMTGWSRERVRGSLDMLQNLKGGMPALQASDEEKDALAMFLHRSLQGGSR